MTKNWASRGLSRSAEEWSKALVYLDDALREQPDLPYSLTELSRRVRQLARALPISAADVALRVWSQDGEIFRAIREAEEVKP